MSKRAVVQLGGITWNHTRGFLPMVATAQRFAETHPGVEIRWEKRTLQEFADFPVEQLIERFDFLVVDHPFVGKAAALESFLPLEEHMPKEFVRDLEANSVGASHSSYLYDGHLWALAIDAATPVASWRRDVLERAGAMVPETWDEVLALARKRLVAFAAIPIDSLMHFYMFCCGLGEEPFIQDGLVVSREVGAAALERLREVVSLCTPEILGWNPIAVYEALSTRHDLAFCPFAYGYSNYARTGYSQNLLEFGDLVEFPNTGRLRSTLGGTGLAISARCQHRDVALQYARFVASPECQSTLYVQSGGQPGHRSAWLDEDANRLTHGYFRSTLPALERAYRRPRYNGYIHFQDAAGPVVHEFLRKGGIPRPVLDSLQDLYEQSHGK